jgi:pimeloyl-ACP methyl ester carboxylesterase
MPIMNRQRFVRSFDGTELLVKSRGEGLPLVLCDGLGCKGFIWKRLIPAFEKRYHIVHWNYRGHGDSKIPDDLATMNIQCLVRDLALVLDELHLDKVVLIGHSMGTQVVLEFALTYPERVLGIVPVCGSYGRCLETFHNNGMLAASFPLLHEVAYRWPRLTQKIWRAAVTSELSYQIGARLEVNGRLVSREDFAPYFEAIAAIDIQTFVAMAENANAHSVEEQLGELKTPTLVVAGERDTFTPVWLSRRMQQLIPEAELLLVPAGSHAAPLEIPELVHLRIERFLNERVLPAVSKAAPAKQAASGSRRRKNA